MLACDKFANGRTIHQPLGLFVSNTALPLRNSVRLNYRRPTAACSALRQSADLQATGQHAGGQGHAENSQTATALIASSLAAIFVVAPGHVQAEQLPDSPAQQDSQAMSILVPAGSLAANLAAPEAPALVSNSGEVLLQGVKGMVESGLQDLAANSMTAVGGPVTGDVLSASASQGSADSPAANDDQAAQQQQQQQAAPQAGQSGGSTAASAALAVQAQQKQHRGLPAGWCTAAWQAYCDALERSPLPTKVYTGVVGTLLGDLAAQVLSHTSKKQQEQHSATAAASSSSQGFHFDALRAGRLCLYSAAVGTPMGHYWYGLLESAVLPATPLAPAAVAAKVLLDQLVQTPIGMALFFALMKVLEGRPQEVQQELESKMLPALLANWKLWPAAQLVNFTLIPEEQRILYGNIIGICWTCVISNMQQASAAANTVSSSLTETAAAATTPGGLAGNKPVLGLRGSAVSHAGLQEYSHEVPAELRLRRRSSASVAA